MHLKMRIRGEENRMKCFINNMALRKATCLLLALALVFPISFSASAASSEDFVDLSLVCELEWSRNPRLFTDQNPDVYVPEGAQVLSIDIVDEVLSVDYKLDSVRYIVSYFPNGTVSKTARADGSNIVQSVSSDDNRIDRFDIEERDYCENESTAYANEKEVIPIMYTEVAGTKPYNAKVVQSSTKKIPELESIGYSAYQNCRVYETMDYFAKNESRSILFYAGQTVDVIAVAFEVAKTQVLSWLTIAGVAISIAQKLEESIKVVNECSYTYLGGKEVGIYDPTSYHDYVEVVQEWGEGIVSLTWTYDSGYKNPTWRHTARSSALMKNNNTLITNAVRIYGLNIESYGLWPHEKGIFGY